MHSYQDLETLCTPTTKWMQQVFYMYVHIHTHIHINDDNQRKRDIDLGMEGWCGVQGSTARGATGRKGGGEVI